MEQLQSDGLIYYIVMCVFTCECTCVRLCVGIMINIKSPVVVMLP